MIDILLATCNGASYLAPQLDSLLSQSRGDWRLLVRDDCSQDDTPSILARYRDRFPERIVILPSSGERLGAAANFAELLAMTDGDYLMFCDQDDVWLPDKIERSLEVMVEMERCYGREAPLLVHTDLTVVDQDLAPISPSLWRFQHCDPVGGTALNRLLIQNTVTGCTALINRPLRELALPLPSETIMHDWWLALVAAAFGHIAHVQEPTVLYRQHGANDIGAIGFTLGDVLRRISTLREGDVVMGRLYCQAGAFLERYRELLTSEQTKLLEAFATMEQVGAVERRRRILKYRFFYTGLIRNIGRLILG